MLLAVVIAAVPLAASAQTISSAPVAVSSGPSSADVDARISSATAGLARASDLTTVKSTADAAAAQAAAAVKTVNGVQPTSGNVAIAVPMASTVMPPCISDAGSAGTAGTMTFAPFNHTHCSKARRARVLVPASGTLAVTWKDSAGANAPFTTTPVCSVTAEATAGDTNVVNAQWDGTPTTTGATIRITRTAVTNSTLLGLTILSVPTQLATYAHYVCLEP